VTAARRSLRSNNRNVARAAKYIAVLGVALVAAAILAGFVGAQRWGSAAYQSSAIAAAINWVAGSAALLTVFAVAPFKALRINGALVAMVVRMALPLVAVMYFTQTRHPLTAKGVVGFTVIHYLIGLAVECWMTVRLLAAADATPPSSVPTESRVNA
jgi:hypothetical protein